MKYCRSFFLMVTFLSMIVTCSSQYVSMIRSGRIDFEKKVNAYSILDEYYMADVRAKDYANEYKETHPRFTYTYFSLLFDNHGRSLYVPDSSNIANKNQINNFLRHDNIVYTDSQAKLCTSIKNFGSQFFLIKDSVRNIHWRYTGESRDIAGFHCRRANAIIMDSIYVVAFYCEQIIPKRGPESFSGLPGMILGVVLPHMHISWFATRVYSENISDLIEPHDGKVMTEEEFSSFVLKDKKDEERSPLDSFIANLIRL